MKNTSYVVSLKYAIGIFKEINLFGEKLGKHRQDVAYIVSTFYEKLFSEENSTKKRYLITKSDNFFSVILESLSFMFVQYKQLKNIFNNNPPELLYFFNFHPLNIPIAWYAKKRYKNCVIAFYLQHPPGFPRSQYGVVKAMLLVIYDALLNNFILMCDQIILPSKNIEKYFYKKYRSSKAQIHYAPLLIPDKSVKNTETKRSYFSYIGGVNPTTGLDDFIRLVNYAAENEIDRKFYLISSSGSVNKYLTMLTGKARKNITIVNKDFITDDEIYEVIKSSYAIFKLVKIVEQSGIIPDAYMFGTTIIGTDVPGLTQDVIDKNTGYIVSLPPKMDELTAGMDYIKSNFSAISVNARKYYEEHFSEECWDKYYKNFVESLK